MTDITVPERFNAVVDIVERWALEAPDDLALISLGAGGEVVAEQTVAQLAADARAAAVAFARAGIAKGDAVFVMLPRIPAWYTAMLGLIRLGAVPMPGPNLLTAQDIAYRLDRGEAVAVITDTAGAQKVNAIAELPASVARRICVGTPPAGW